MMVILSSVASTSGLGLGLGLGVGVGVGVGLGIGSIGALTSGRIFRSTFMLSMRPLKRPPAGQWQPEPIRQSTWSASSSGAPSFVGLGIGLGIELWIGLG